MRKKVVLVVDDEKLIRWSIRQKLESAQYEVLEAGTAAEADSLFKENMPDLVTLDVRLPDTNGLKVLLEMKKLAPDTPIIMITAYAALETVADARDSGVDEFMAKPLSAAALEKRIQRVLEDPRPFVEAPEFSGPDRRRRNIEIKGEDRRVGATGSNNEAGEMKSG